MLTPEWMAREVARMKLNVRLSRGRSVSASRAAVTAVGVSTEIDPVCKKAIHSRRIVSKHNGEAYYFCSPACKTTFDADPAKYFS